MSREVSIVVSSIAEIEQTYVCRVADNFEVTQENALSLIDAEEDDVFSVRQIIDVTIGHEENLEVVDIR